MIALDTSILAYAVNRYAPEHPRAARLLEELVNSERPWALPWTVVYDFMRLVTHPHAVARPLQPEDARAFLAPVLASPSLRMLGPGARHAEALGQVLAELRPGDGLAGLDTAALLREHGVRELLSGDPGMRRFRFLSVRDPLHGEEWTPESQPLRRYRVLGSRRGS